MKFLHTFEYESPIELNIGDVFYKVELGKTHYYNEPCLVCNDTGKVTVNGVTFKCPVCHTGTTQLIIKEFFVRRYRIYELDNYTGHDNWKSSLFRSQKIHLYSKTGKGIFMGSYNERELNLNIFVENLNRDDRYFNSYGSDYVFFNDYKKAVNVAKELTQKEILKLKEFGKLHKKEYEFIQKMPNDKPSK